MTRVLPPLKAGHDGGQVGLELVRALERVEHRLVVGLPVSDLLATPALHLTPDEPAECLADALGPGEETEVVPDVVGDLDTSLAIADRRRPLPVGIPAGSSAGTGGHGE